MALPNVPFPVKPRFPVIATLLVVVIVVNLPVLAVDAPIDILLIDPPPAGASVTVPEPVGLSVTFAPGLSVTVELAVSVVNDPVPPEILPIKPPPE